MTKRLGKYSFGTGDRFGLEGKAQLEALLKLEKQGTHVTPVWNKSHREHSTVNSNPKSVRKEADEAVENCGYTGSYFVDADHINRKIVGPYIPVSDFFTIDVADYIGKEAGREEKEDFLEFISKYSESLQIPGIQGRISIEEDQLNEITNTFMFAAKKAAEVYRYIRSEKEESFVVEVSMDEVERPQTPVELFFALAALAFYEIPVNTIAPKFTGRFNKGIDYEGDLARFEKEFEEDILVISYAKKEFGFPSDLKLSVHSGSDKFSIYPVMNRLIKEHEVGLHVKTAGTTWLEEITVLAESGESGFDFAVEVYKMALDRFEELTSPYPDVLDIDRSKLPEVNAVRKEGGTEMAKALRHDPAEEKYNPHFRQLMHCAYKIAAEKADEFYPLLDEHRGRIEENVEKNLFEKHIKPLFLS